MSSLLSLVVLVTVATVVIASFVVLWRERASRRDAWIAIASGTVLVLWAAIATVLARGGAFRPAPGETIPPLGRSLVLTLLALSACLSISAPLRGLLSRQTSLIRLHRWRFFGTVFLVLMARGQLPALFALPAGIGDILVAATAPWIARGIGTPRGRRRAIIWNLLGMADLVVAVALGITTNPGGAQLFKTTPTSQILTHFPLALVPAFLVPLAFTLHGVSLWQLLGKRWAHALRGGAEPKHPQDAQEEKERRNRRKADRAPAETYLRLGNEMLAKKPYAKVLAVRPGYPNPNAARQIVDAKHD